MFMFRNKRRFFLVILVAVMSLSLGLITEKGNAASVGQTLNSVKIKDSNNNPKCIPDIGKKVITIFYVDPDQKDATDPIADALKAKKFDEKKSRIL